MDLHPTDDKTSLIPTSPPAKSNAVYRKRPAEYGQLGRATSYQSVGEYFASTAKPHYYQLAAWDYARRNEPIISDGLSKLALSVLAKLGDYNHENPAIQTFVRANLTDVKTWLYNMTLTMLWSGFTVSEPIWQKKEGPNGIPQVWIEDVINYHPTQVEFKLNLYGRLTHGEKIPTSQYLTGVWVPIPQYYTVQKAVSANFTGGLVRLPRSKVLYCAINNEGNNPYGTSLVAPILKYHLFKEAYKDMMAVALDRYGTPLIWVVVPPQNTEELVQEPDGSTRYLTLHEMAARELENMRSETGIIFTQIDKDHPVKLEALTTGNNFADSFIKAIEMCDHNMMRGLSIPNLIMKDDRNGLGTGGSSERQVEIYHMFVESIYSIVTGALLNQLIRQLIQYNFDPRDIREAYDPGYFTNRPFRYADLAVLTGTIQAATSMGYCNPSDPEDFGYVRSLLSLPSREMTAADKQYIKSLAQSATKSKPISKPNMAGSE